MWDVVRQVFVRAWQQFTQQSLAVLPNVLAGLLFLAIGLFFAAIVGRISRWTLRRSRLDLHSDRLGLATWLERFGIFSAAAALARLIQALLVLMSAMLALYSLDTVLASDLVRRFFLYLPHVAVALIIVAVGVLLSRFVERSIRVAAVNMGLSPARAIGTLARGAIAVLAIALAMEHLGIGGGTVPAVLLILLGGVTFAAALAIGLGSREAVKRWLDQLGSSEKGRDELHH
ncbi:MAG: hypothetical protein AB1806_20045, partial [Acidobacteriota bacterium]